MIVFSFGPSSLATHTSGDAVLAGKVTEILGSKTAAFDSLSVMVVDSDGTAVHAGFGTQADGRPITPATRFEIGSVAKGLTGMLLASLEDRELIDSSAAFGANAGSPSGPLLADLATHHAGLPRNSPSAWRAARVSLSWLLDRQPRNDTSADIVRDVVSAWTRDARFSYSNLGFAGLGVSLAKSQGVAFEALLRSEVLEPLKMTDTELLSVGDPVPSDHAIGLGLNYRPAQPWVSEPWQGAGIGVWSTAQDLTTLMKAIRNGTAPGIRATTGLRDANERQRIGYGWFVGSIEDQSVVWNGGQTAGYRSFVALSQTTGRIVVVLSNSYRAPVDDLALSLLTGTVVGGTSKLSLVLFYGVAIVMLWTPVRRLRGALRGKSSRFAEVRATTEMFTTIAVAYLIINWRLVDSTILYLSVVIGGAALGASATILSKWSQLPTSIAKRPRLDAITSLGSGAAALFILILLLV
ncbi:MAG: serine hydrolase [Acidimicrobiaceae bacterium]|nr:serine hydrolase [Acidimicrobiaceae bacterium]MDE0605627.1 serine hydrolase [Acidimicrobiaceae bacterium]